VIEQGAASNITPKQPVVSDIDRDFPPMPEPAAEKPAPGRADKVKQEFRHAALWTKAGKAKLLAPATIEAWKISPGYTADEIAARCELMHVALDPAYTGETE